MTEGRDLRCDIAVVGGGSAGCVVAGRLAAETGAEVILLEAGPDYGPRGSTAWPADLLDAGALGTSDGWGYTTGNVHSERGPIDLSRARVIGGCSSHNGCIAAVGCDADYDGWAALTGDSGWSAAALRPLFERALARLEVRLYEEDEVGPFHRACLAAAASLGLPRADDLANLDGGVGFGIEPVNAAGRMRVNAAFAYLDPARDRSNLRILDRALGDRIVPAAAGVEIVVWRDGAELRIRAGRVVLAAGAYGTPAILLRSGIGDPGVLRPHGIETVHALPGVGRNLHDHPLVEIDFEGTDALHAAVARATAEGFVPEEQTLGKLRSTRATGPYDLHLIPVSAPLHSPFGGRTFIAASAMEPRSRGRLVLASRDPKAQPIIDHGYLTDPEGHDLAVLVEGVALVRELAATSPLRDLIGPEATSRGGGSTEDLIRRTFVHYFHPVGTCAMGCADDPAAVCDARGRVLGLERVLVADCSLMPVVPRANTNVPAVVVGERIADLLVAG